MTILTEAELRRIVKLDLDAVACVENAFRALATQTVAMPPILRLDIPEHRGEVDVKTAYVPGIDGFAIKISPGFFDNPKLGLPSTNGLMVLLSATTGLTEALLLDNGYLTDVRTAAAGAVAAKYLARADASVAAIFGAGMQARMQLEALMLVRPIRQARIWARDPTRADRVAGELRDQLGIEVRAEPDAAKAAAGADVIVTTTPATEPLIHADSAAQTRRLGELHHAIDAGLVAADAGVAELGQIIAGARPGRRAASDITLADLTGTGVQDTAIATLARDRARSAGAGTILES
jgi:ornithine cyclodeaminase